MIAFQDFKAEYQFFKQAVDKGIQRVLDRGWFVLGPEGEAFESEFSTYTASPYCVGVASGTEAIALALMCADIGAGDEVLTTSLTAFPTISAILQVGATPVVSDVDETTGLLDLASATRLISPKTKAIIPVHLYGNSCDMTAIQTLAKQHRLIIIEDCAQATGTRFKNQHVGTFGRFGVFSFYPTKNLGAYGDGGAILCRDKSDYDKLTYLRNYGQTKRYHHEHSGINSRLDEIQAAILRAKLCKLESLIEKRRQIAARYSKALAPYALSCSNDVFHSYHLFVLSVSDRDTVMSNLSQAGVQTLIHYPIEISAQVGFSGRSDNCVKAKGLCDRLMSLPLHPFLPPQDVETVITATRILLDVA